MKKTKPYVKPLIFILIILSIIIIINTLNLARFLSLSYIKTQLEIWKVQFETQKLFFISAYFIIYIIVATLSIPGATVLTLLGGALFGLVQGTIIVSFASTIGATLSFITSRFFLRENIEKKFKEQYKKINEGIKKDGSLYLFALRLVPLFPFFIINLAMGITRIPILTYLLVSQLGMLPGTLVYVNAGKALTTIHSTSGIFTFQIFGAFALLATLPVISKKIISLIKRKKAYKGFTCPSKFDTNIIVIGSGAGGLISAYIAATVNASVYLIEKNEMGGDCLNRGCVPSKALLSASKYARMHTHTNKLGIKYAKPSVSFSKVMNTVHQSIQSVAPHDSIERYEKLGVKCIKGTAKIISPWEVQVENKVYKTKSIIIATGGSPAVPEIPRLIASDTLTSDSVWKLQIAPKKLVIVGGGPIGCELALAFASLDVEVTLVQRDPQLLHKEDVEVGEAARHFLETNKVSVITNAVPTKVKKSTKKLLAIKYTNGTTKNIAYDKILIATGRKANTSSIGLENVNIALNKNGTITTDQYLRTNIPNIFAVGDVTGPYQFTHIASHMAWYATINALFGKLKLFAIDYKIVPAVTFLDPEIARVGITEKKAIEQNIEYESTIYYMNELDRAIVEQKTNGFIKVITAKGSDKILGATVVAERGGEILGQFILGMKHNLGLNKILGTIYPYPTYMEAGKSIAGIWKKNHAPEKLLNVLKKIFNATLH